MLNPSKEEREAIRKLRDVKKTRESLEKTMNDWTDNIDVMNMEIPVFGHAGEKESHSLAMLKYWIQERDRDPKKSYRQKMSNVERKISQLYFPEGEQKYIHVKNWREFLELARQSYEKRRDNQVLTPVRKQDFEFKKTLATGAFSRVVLVRFLSNRHYYAAKVMSKRLLVRDKHVKHAFNEKQILNSIRFPFCIHLEFFFQDNVYLYYIMPFVNGGELFTLLSKMSRFKEDLARFYAAQMLLALEYLHFLGLIFRDLKPENVLIDGKGFIKLADFGFCKAVQDRTYTFCGTAEYLAPEILNQRGYGRSVDWWTFGIFTFELCAGYTPFYSKLVSRTYENITRCKYKMPMFFSNDLRDLIRSTLQVDLSKRYGILRNGVNDIKEHKWFGTISWTMIVNLQVKPPHIPAVDRMDDTSNFDAVIEEPFEESLTDPYQREFANF